MQMNTTIKYQFVSILFLITLAFISCKSQYNGSDNLQYIDPQIGGVAPLLKPTKTRMHIPNAMVRMNPERKDYRGWKISILL